jgi:hypothetical protein
VKPETLDAIAAKLREVQRLALETGARDLILESAQWAADFDWWLTGLPASQRTAADHGDSLQAAQARPGAR